jgi:hypothetical protein
MANSVDIITCSHANFLKYLEESKPIDQTFKDMFSQFNEKYISLSKEIYQINEVRSELLTKIKAAQQEYKRLLGHGEIKPVIDVNDDEELDKPAAQENKVPDKRGRKKADVKDSTPATKDKVDAEPVDDIDSELENIPKMKTKVAKETKKTVKSEIIQQTEDAEAEAEEDAEEVEQAPVKTTKKVPTQTAVKKLTKTVKKVEVEPEAEPEPEPEPEADPEPEEVPEVKPVAKAKKTVAKSVKNVVSEPVEEVQEVQEVKPKTTTKKKTTK